MSLRFDKTPHSVLSNCKVSPITHHHSQLRYVGTTLLLRSEYMFAFCSVHVCSRWGIQLPILAKLLKIFCPVCEWVGGFRRSGGRGASSPPGAPASHTTGEETTTAAATAATLRLPATLCALRSRRCATLNRAHGVCVWSQKLSLKPTTQEQRKAPAC